MKFNCKLEELRPGRISLNAGPTYLHPTICIQGQLPHRVASSKADMEFAWTGFNLLETGEGHVVTAVQAGLGPFLVSGTGILALSQDMFSFDPGEDCNTKIPDEVWLEAAEFLSIAVAGTHNISPEEVLIVSLREQLSTAEKQSFQFVVSVCRAIKEEDWHKNFAVKSLELSAATRFWKAQGNEMVVEPAEIPDLQPNRTLN